MSHTCSNVLVHVVFSTKNREKTLTAAVRKRRHAYLAKVVNDRGGTAHVVGGGLEHVHLLIRLPPRLSRADLMRRVKASSSTWVRRNFDPRFGWQQGYSAFSVSFSQYRTVYDYIESQEEHHRRRSYETELLSLLKRNEIEYDERFLWG